MDTVYFLCMQKWKCHVDPQSLKSQANTALKLLGFLASCPGLPAKWLKKSHKFITGDVTCNVLN